MSETTPNATRATDGEAAATETVAMWRNGRLYSEPVDFNLPHTCGSHGFDPTLGDACWRCDAISEARRRLLEQADEMEQGGTAAGAAGRRRA